MRGKKIRTTTADPGHERAADLLNRDFTAARPNRCWVADFTHVAAWSGVVYVAFVVDVYSRAIVGWSAATNKRTPLVLAALDMGCGAVTAPASRSGRAWYITAMRAVSTRRSGSPPTCSMPVSMPRSAASVTPWTTR
ncbi:DDE-type integrase/transposase/recombinase [Micromonospora aurantiaca (nom. illeg.)]|uniref:DDE-type integrase/transposase/recombinase n=1 Tax=Micromonospora aurantiaca (nom. illeg.) TaxID=47850 RepID=UPI0033F94956